MKILFLCFCAVSCLVFSVLFMISPYPLIRFGPPVQNAKLCPARDQRPDGRSIRY